MVHNTFRKIAMRVERFSLNPFTTGPLQQTQSANQTSKQSVPSEKN